jgi:hypothetical protein
MIDFKPDQKESIPDLVRRKAGEYGVDPNIALGVAEQESNFNPDARNKKSGATGVMQLMPKTAKGLGVKDSKNPEQNVDAGVRYLSTLHEKHGGNTDKALAEYGGFKKKDPTSYVEGVKEKAQKYVAPKVDFKADKSVGPLGRAAESIVKRSRELAPEVVGNYVGVLEGLVTTVSGVGAFPLSVAAGVGAMVGQAAKQGNFEVDPEVYSEAQEKVARVLTYQPKTEKGEFQARTLGAPFELLGKAQEKGLEFVPEKYRGQAKIASDVALIAAPFAKSFVLRPIRESNWYRRMTIKERGLVNRTVQNMKDSGMSDNDIIKEQWKDPTKREELLKKYAGVQEEPKAEVKPKPKEESKTPPVREGKEPTLKSKWSEMEYFDEKLKEGGAPFVPGVKSEGKTFVGQEGERHLDVLNREGLKEGERGFVDREGNWLTRQEAKDKLEKEHPELYDAWVKENEEGELGELHAPDLNAAIEGVDKPEVIAEVKGKPQEPEILEKMGVPKEKHVEQMVKDVVGSPVRNAESLHKKGDIEGAKEQLDKAHEIGTKIILADGPKTEAAVDKELQKAEEVKKKISRSLTMKEEVSPTSLSPKELPVPPAAPLIEAETPSTTEGVSKEEISRPGVNYEVDASRGSVSFLGKKVDVGKGKASIGVTETGELVVRSNNTKMSDDVVLRAFGDKIKGMKPKEEEPTKVSEVPAEEVPEGKVDLEALVKEATKEPSKELVSTKEVEPVKDEPSKEPWQMPKDEWIKFAEKGKIVPATGVDTPEELAYEKEAKIWSYFGQGEAAGYSPEDIAQFYVKRYKDEGIDKAYEEYMADASYADKDVPREIIEPIYDKIDAEDAKKKEEPKPEAPSDWFKRVTEAYSGKKAEELLQKFGKTREDYMLASANEEVRPQTPEELTLEQLEGYERTFKGEAYDKDSLLIRRDAAERLGVSAKGKDPEQLKKEVLAKVKELKPKAKSGLEDEISEKGKDALSKILSEEVKSNIKEIIANIKPEVPTEVIWDYFDLDGLLKAHGISKDDFIKEEQKLIMSDEIKKAIEKLRLPKKESLGEAGFVDLTKLKDVGKDLWDFYKKRPEFTPMKEMIGKYTGGLQVIDLELTKLAKRINEEIPKDKQAAINVYMEAGGDPEVLKKYASTVKGDYKKMYEDAINLSPEERVKADEFRRSFDELWIAAFGEDVIDSYIENYVRHQWKDPEKAGAKTLAGLQAGFFRANPREAMQRVFQDNYEGIQAGYEPVDMRIGYQLVSWQRSVRQAILARKFLKSLMKSKEVDGRPSVVIGGSGKPIKSEDVDLKKAHFIKANNKGQDTRNFKFIDHPALRRWKWIGETEDGSPIYMEGNMWVHPDAYHRMNAMFGKSAIREFKIPDRVPLLGGRKPGKGALSAGGFIKGTVLVGPFHHVHMTEHALFHKVNPFTTREIDFNERPVLKDLVDHGLMLYNHNALAEFGEGLASGGAWKYVPVVGENLRRYQEWLFTDYIPRLKAEMAEHAVERAKGYYEKQLASGELTMDQLLENAALQSNAAFGEQNYKYLGRNPSFQDALRIALLAPDFLEARLRFGGQAMRSYGKEQTMALLRGAAIMGSAAIIASLLFGDDHKWNPNRPFSVVVGGREYTPRSVVGDIAHLIADPRGFWYYRLNPLWGRPVAQLATGRDEKGRKSTPLNVAKDTLKTWVPIPAQGLVKDTGDDVLNAMMHGLLSSVGLSNYEYQTDFGRYSMKLDRPAYPKTEKSAEKSKIVHQLKTDRKEGMKSLREAMKKSVITERDRNETEERAFHPGRFSAKKMTLEELAKGIDSTTLTRQERTDILPVFNDKLNKAWEEGKLSKGDRNRYSEILRKLKERQ